jgi:hypothetical protein
MSSFMARLAVTIIAVTTMPIGLVIGANYDPYGGTDPLDCDASGTKTVGGSDNLGECYCKESISTWVASGIPVEYANNTQGTYPKPLWETASFNRVGCPIPECKAGIADKWGNKGFNGEKLSECICKASKVFSDVYDSCASAAGCFPSDWTEAQSTLFEAFCGVQVCYDAMEALANASATLPDFCGQFPDPSTLPPSPPAILQVKMTLDMDVASFDQMKPTLKTNMEALYKCEITSLTATGGSLAVDATMKYESANMATMATKDVEGLDTATIGTQLGVSVLSIEAPTTVAAASPPPPASGDDNTALIVGATVGGVAGLAILVLLGWLYFVKGKGGAGASTSQTDQTSV